MKNSLAFTFASSLVVFTLMLASTGSPRDRAERDKSNEESDSDAQQTIELLERASDETDDGTIVYVQPASP